MSHWALPFIGRPWWPVAMGPHAYDCRGLVRAVYKLRLGRDVKPLMPEHCHDAHAVIQAAIDDGFVQVGRGVNVPGQELDIVMMTGPLGPHVGTLVRDGDRLLLLHAVGGPDDNDQPQGEVIAESRQDAAVRGYGRFLHWRLA
jgi:hypothetical protein